MTPLFAIFGLGPMELAVIGVIGILLFGRKLPEMGRYLGQTIVGFKQGMSGLEGSMNDTLGGNPTPHAQAPVEPARPPQRVTATAPKFDDSPINTGITTNPPQV
jgi:sec-independent protein translocase protein TatA